MAQCEHCQTDLPPQVGRGRPRQYCDDACRQAAHRERHAPEPDEFDADRLIRLGRLAQRSAPAIVAAMYDSGVHEIVSALEELGLPVDWDHHHHMRLSLKSQMPMGVTASERVNLLAPLHYASVISAVDRKAARAQLAAERDAALAEIAASLDRNE